MKLVFCGTPGFAVPTLEVLLAAGHEIALAVSQPDRPVGRGQQLTAPPVKQAALAAGLPVTQPEKIKNNTEFRAQLEAIAPDAIVVVAYGRIIPPWMLALPRLGCINLHGSLLPKYRGAAPIQWAVAMGDAFTGNTTMLLEEGLDTGPILLQQAFEIGSDATSMDLFEALAQKGAPLVVETLAGLASGTIQPQPQNHSFATFALLLDREDGRMDFAGRTARELYNRWRGFQPWPGAFTTLDGKKLIVHRMEPVVAMEMDPSPVLPGQVRVEDHRLFAACAAESWIELLEVQLEGKKRLSAVEFLRGTALAAGARLGGCYFVTSIKKRAPKNHPAPISLARKAAFDILMAVEKGHSHSDDLLRNKAVDALSPADRNLATTLVLGVLRWQILLDHELLPLLKHPNARLDPEVLIALRLGAFQLLHLDRIPARAAIDESVELAKRAGHRFASGMVNAVLRKLNTAPRIQLPEETVEELALATGHPEWLVERWCRFYGLEPARAICRHGQSQPSLSVRMENAAVDAELTAAGIHAEAGKLLTAARTIIAGDPAGTEAYREGHIRFQDEGSQLIAELAAGDASESLERILDCCAAPGGKTLILAERHTGAHIVACEASPQRLDALRKRLAPHAGQIECRLADATALEEESAFDLVLADVPCSGTGTLGRNPEIRHRLRPEDLNRQAERQRGILRSALRAVRPGGRVVYSTCSLEPEENEQVVAAALGEHPDAHLISLRSGIEGLQRAGILTAFGAAGLLACIMLEGAIRLLPGSFHTDGFFIALIEKVR